MKRALIIGLAACLALAGVVWLFWPPPPVPQKAVFIGYTTNVFLPPGWTINAHKAAIFVITNQQTYTIRLERLVSAEALKQAGPEPWNLAATYPPRDNGQTPYVQSLAPRQATTLQVPVYWEGCPWKARFFYVRDPASDSLAQKIKALLRRLRAAITRTQVVTERYSIESEWIER